MLHKYIRTHIHTYIHTHTKWQGESGVPNVREYLNGEHLLPLELGQFLGALFDLLDESLVLDLQLLEVDHMQPLCMYVCMYVYVSMYICM